MFAAEIRKRRVSSMRRFPQWRWHLDEVFVKINGKLCYLWRAVDHEGEVLETVVTAKRDKAAALKFLKRIMKKYGRPRSVVTDGLSSYPAAMSEIGSVDRQEVGHRLNNRAENSHQPFRRRERAMQRFRSAKISPLTLFEGATVTLFDGRGGAHGSFARSEVWVRIGLPTTRRTEPSASRLRPSLAPCSGPSRTSPVGRAWRASLTAPARDASSAAQVGTRKRPPAEQGNCPNPTRRPAQHDPIRSRRSAAFRWG